VFSLRRGGVEHVENSMKKISAMLKWNGQKISWALNRFVPCTSKDSLLETTIAVANTATADFKNPLHLLIRALIVFKIDSNETMEFAK
jgi:hypothetical protein